jgi:hypothetical protein
MPSGNPVSKQGGAMKLELLLSLVMVIVKAEYPGINMYIYEYVYKYVGRYVLKTRALSKY